MSNDLLWNNFLDVIRSKISTVSFDTWFKDTKLLNIQNGKMIIKVPMTFHKKFLNDTYYDLIEEIITNLTGTNYDLEFVVEEDIEPVEVLNVQKEEVTNINSNLNPR